jgi:hypothetical protein
MSSSEDSRVISSGWPSHKFNKQKRKQEVIINEGLSLAEAYHYVGPGFQEESETLNSSTITSQNSYNEYDWESCNTTSSERCELSECNRLESYNHSKMNFELIDAMNHDDHVAADQRRKSEDQSWVSFQVPRVQSHSEQEDNHERSDIKSSFAEARLMSSIKILMPGQLPAHARPYCTWKNFSFESTICHKSSEGSIRSAEHQ